MSATDPPQSGRPRSASDWDARYVEGNAPWDTGRADAHLQAIVASRPLAPCRVLEVGCGTGTDAVWLAQQGFEVTGVDFSQTAIARAKQRARDAGVEVAFDVGSGPDESGRFALAYDCGCFHTIAEASARSSFASELARRLQADGLWLSIAGSTDGPPRDHGPPRLSATELVGSVEADFEVLSLTSGMYDADIPTPARAWIMLLRKRP